MEAQTYENTYVELAFSKFNISKRRTENDENWEASAFMPPKLGLQTQWDALDHLRLAATRRQPPLPLVSDRTSTNYHLGDYSSGAFLRS